MAAFNLRRLICRGSDRLWANVEKKLSQARGPVSCFSPVNKHEEIARASRPVSLCGLGRMGVSPIFRVRRFQSHGRDAHATLIQFRRRDTERTRIIPAR